MQIENITTEDDVKENNVRIVITQNPLEPPMAIATRPQDWEERARAIIFGRRIRG